MQKINSSIPVITATDKISGLIHLPKSCDFNSNISLLKIVLVLVSATMIDLTFNTFAKQFFTCSILLSKFSQHLTMLTEERSVIVTFSSQNRRKRKNIKLALNSTFSYCVIFFLLWYSVVCTVESLSFLYLFLYLDLYILGADVCLS